MRRELFAILVILFSLLVEGQTLNPDKPEKGIWDMQMRKIWETDTAGRDVFGGIQEIDITRDGKTLIMDYKNFKIFIFDKEGRFISSFGEKGEGPGEFRNMQMGEQLFTVDNNIIVVDRGRIHYFSNGGKFLKTEVYPFQTKPRAFVSSDIFISAPGTVEDTRNPQAEIKVYNLKDNSEKIITTFKPFEKATATQQNRGNQVIIAIVLEEVTPLMMVKYQEGKIYYGMSNRYQLNVADLQGNPLLRFGIEDRKPVPVSTAYKKRLGQQFKDIPQEMVKRIIDGLPDNATFFYDIFVDKKGIIYLLISNPENRNSKKVDIFSEAGKYLYASEIRMEPGSSINYITFNDHNIFIASEDEDGNQKVSKFLVKLPE